MNVIKRTNYPIIFDEFFNDFFNVKPISVPPNNILETESDFQIEFSVPGSNKKDFKIEVENDNIKIIKKKEDLDTTNKYSRQEFNYSFFEKSFYLPESIDQSKISSKYDNGILRISLPKKSEVIIQNQRKFITVK